MKIQGQNEEMLLAACEQFLSKSDDEIQQVKLVGILNRDCDESERGGYSKGKDDDDDDDGDDDDGNDDDDDDDDESDWGGYSK